MASTSGAQPLRRNIPRSTTAAAEAKQKPHRVSLADQVGSSTATKNVLVLGGSYGGMHAASVLANRLPPSHRVILIERNSHFNHLYVFPRFSVLPGHEHKAFIPYTSIFKDAPKRQRTRPSKNVEPVAGPSNQKQSNTAQVTVDPSTTSARSTDLLGMGSAIGKSLKNKSSTSTSASDSSDDSRIAGSSRFGTSSSASRSSSVDDDPLFDKRLRVPELAAADASSDAHSATSSYHSSMASNRITWDEQDEKRAAKLAESSGVMQAMAQEGVASRAEEALGRPEMEVEELGEAIEKGISLDDQSSAELPQPGKGTATDEENERSFDESSPHLVLQANVESITPTHVVVRAVGAASSSSSNSNKGLHQLWSIDSVSIPYSHLVYALGSHLPDPLRTEARLKKDGVGWMQEMQARVQQSNEIVLVGGGALGVEFATDIKNVHPEKSVTLIHSRKQLLPNFDEQVHAVALEQLNKLGVRTVLGERLALTEGCPRGSTVRPEDIEEDTHPNGLQLCPTNAKSGEGEQARNEGVCLGNGRKLVKTTGGKQFECDMLLLCTGQQPNSELMARLSPTSVDSNSRLVRVMPTLQVKVPDPHGSLAQMPFDARPPCGDCDCFLDKKAAGRDADHEADDDGSLSKDGKATTHHDTYISNVYAIGDVADAFGALNAGYQAWSMADVAAENILHDIEGKQHDEFTAFVPAPNLLKLSLGLGKKVVQGAPNEQSAGRPVVELCEDEEDLCVEGVWKFMAGMSTDDMYV